MFDLFRYLRIFGFAATLVVGGCAPGPGVEPPMSIKDNAFDAGAENGNNSVPTGSNTAGAAGAAARDGGNQDAMNAPDSGKQKTDAE